MPWAENLLRKKNTQKCSREKKIHIIIFQSETEHKDFSWKFFIF